MAHFLATVVSTRHSMFISDTPAWVVAQMQTLAADRGWSTFAGLQVEYSLVQREVERALIPMARGLADIARGTGAY